MQPFGALAGGVLGSLVGVPATLVVGCIGMLCSVLWLVRSPVRSIQRMPTEAPLMADVS